MVEAYVFYTSGSICFLFFTALLIIHRDASRQRWISLGSIIIYVRDTLQLRGKERNQLLCNRIPNCKTPLHRLAVHFLSHLDLPRSQVGQTVQNNLYNTTLRSLKRSCTPCFTSCKLTFFKAVLFCFPHTTKYIKSLKGTFFCILDLFHSLCMKTYKRGKLTLLLAVRHPQIDEFRTNGNL